MTFNVRKAQQKHFDDLDAVIDFAAGEQKRIYRLPLLEFLKQGGRFQDDNSLGVPSKALFFNEYGFDAISRLAGTNPYFLQRLSEEGLASQILNDVLLAGKTTKSLESQELICDEDSNQVLGIVSNKYVGYSNKEFIDDVFICLESGNQQSLFHDTGDFEFIKAYSVNTRLFMRIKSKHVIGKVSGIGGRGDDISEIGVEFSNSMAGGHAVRLAYFIHRLICANGLIAKVGGSDGRLVHSGNKQHFRKRLYKKASIVLSGLDNAKRMIETLGGMAFDSRKLASLIDLKDVLKIILDRETRDKCEDSFTNRDYSYIKDKQERALRKKSDHFEQIPLSIGGKESLSVFDSPYRNTASMYDFINVFTEYAKSLDEAQRLQTEEKAGDLADWITKNKRKFA